MSKVQDKIITKKATVKKEKDKQAPVQKTEATDDKQQIEVMLAEKIGFASSKDGQYVMMECTGSDGEVSRVAIPTLKIPALAAVLFNEAQNAAMRLPNDQVVQAAAEALQNEGGAPLMVTGMKLTTDGSDLMMGLGFTVLRLNLCDEARKEIKRCVTAMRRKQEKAQPED